MGKTREQWRTNPTCLPGTKNGHGCQEYIYNIVSNLQIFKVTGIQESWISLAALAVCWITELIFRQPRDNHSTILFLILSCWWCLCFSIFTFSAEFFVVSFSLFILASSWQCWSKNFFIKEFPTTDYIFSNFQNIILFFLLSFFSFEKHRGSSQEH